MARQLKTVQESQCSDVESLLQLPRVVAPRAPREAWGFSRLSSVFEYAWDPKVPGKPLASNCGLLCLNIGLITLGSSGLLVGATWLSGQVIWMNVETQSRYGSDTLGPKVRPIHIL